MGQIVATKTLNLPAAGSAEAAMALLRRFAIERREPLSHQAVVRPPLARGLFRDLPLADADEGPERERGDEVEQEQQRK